MCEFASFFHCITNGEVAVYDLESHGNTEQKLNLNKNIWREGHYLSTGEFELRYNNEDRIDKVEYKTAFRNKFPTFVIFLNWALKEIVKNGKLDGSLNLRGLTSAKDLVLPQTVGGYLYLNGLTSADKEELRKKFPYITI